MIKNLLTTDEDGFDYMANVGEEEQHRDAVGIIIALLLVAVVTIFQYSGLV